MLEWQNSRICLMDGGSKAQKVSGTYPKSELLGNRAIPQPAHVPHFPLLSVMIQDLFLSNGISYFLNHVCACVYAKLLWSCPTLYDPMDCSLPGSSVHGDSPGKKYWNGLPFPPLGDLPNPGIRLASLTSPALTGRFFITSATQIMCTEAQV